jgi:hypothetical protein
VTVNANTHGCSWNYGSEIQGLDMGRIWQRFLIL